MRITLTLILLAQLAFGQNDLRDAERELVRLGTQTFMARAEADRLAYADSFAGVLDETIGTAASFSYAFAEVKNLSSLVSPDQNFRVYTWSVPMKDGSFSFFGRLVLKTENGFKKRPLTDRADSTDSPEYRQLKAGSWYGAVYYDIIKTKQKKTTYYTLLGYRPNKRTHTEKVLEVLNTEDTDPLRFGAKIFNTPRIHGYKHPRKPYRLIFRYHPRLTTTLRYEKGTKRIVFDHLAPPDASQNGEWNVYGPDFTFDALFWDKGKWQLEEGIEIKNEDLKPVTPAPTEKGLPDRN